MRLINDVQVVNLVLARSQLLQYLHIFTSTPDGVYWYVQGVGLVEEEGQF